MIEQHPVIDRLRDLGRQPVDPATSSRHLSAMATAGASRHRLSTRLKVGLAFAAGLLIGGTGPASAGALPAPAQDAAHKTLSKVGVKVPQGTQRFNDPAVCGLDPNTGQPFRNHGQYVRAHKGDPAAAGSRCGKPVQAGQEPDAPSAEPKTPADPNANPGKGNGRNNGRGNNGQRNGNGNGSGKHKDKAAKAEDKDAAEPSKDAAPAAKPSATTVAPAATTSTLAPTTTGSAPPSTTSKV